VKRKVDSESYKRGRPGPKMWDRIEPKMHSYKVEKSELALIEGRNE